MSEASGKGWRTAREQGDLLAGKAVRLHQEGCSDGGPRFPSQQASHGQRAAVQGEEVVESLQGGSRLSRWCGDKVILEDISLVVLGGP